jgi:hypothetical protein
MEPEFRKRFNEEKYQDADEKYFDGAAVSKEDMWKIDKSTLNPPIPKEEQKERRREIAESMDEEKKTKCQEHNIHIYLEDEK